MEETYLDKKSFFSGIILSKDNLSIQGKVEGNLESSKDILIGAGSVVKGEIRCMENLDLKGDFDGLISTNKLFLYKDTQLKGKVFAKNMSIKKMTKNIDAKIKIVEEKKNINNSNNKSKNK